MSLTNRTAVYGPVRTVVWEGSGLTAAPYPDFGTDKRHQQSILGEVAYTLQMPRPVRYVLPLLLICGVSIAADPAASTQPAAPRTAHLVIHTADLRNHDGQLIFGVFKTADGFPNTEKKSVNWQVKPATSDGVFECDLPPGVYAASILHDENSNGDMDFNLAGVPTEGYGVTNNPKPRFRKAKFDEATFTLPASGAKLTISIQYKFY